MIPDSFLIVRGGMSDVPPPGAEFSVAIGHTLDEAAAGVPHGFIRTTTASQIRAAGGKLQLVPEIDPKTGTMNRQHAHLIEGDSLTSFGPPILNPVPKRRRFGGLDYRSPDFDPGAQS